MNYYGLVALQTVFLALVAFAAFRYGVAKGRSPRSRSNWMRKLDEAANTDLVGIGVGVAIGITILVQVIIGQTANLEASTADDGTKAIGGLIPLSFAGGLIYWVGRRMTA